MRSPEKSQEVREGDDALLPCADDDGVLAEDCAPSRPAIYYVEVWVPRENPAPGFPEWRMRARLDSTTPFAAVHVGDLLDPRVWRGYPREDRRTRYRVLSVEHVFWITKAARPNPPGPRHVVMLYVERVLDAAAARRGGYTPLDAASRKLARTLAAIPRDEDEWTWAAGLLKKRAQKGAKRRP